LGTERLEASVSNRHDLADLDTSDLIALGAVLISLVAFLRGEFTLRSERRDREHEDERRDEEIRLLRATS
jgi:hypothetical protein